jgi:tetratricopeptide (TPR) repeat protein
VGNIIKINRRKSWFRLSNNKDKKISRKIRLIILCIVAAIFVGGVVSGWFYMSYQRALREETRVKEAKKTSNAIYSAGQLVNTGRIDEARDAYDAAIKNTDDTHQKSVLLINKSILYKREKNFEKALLIAKEAEVLEPNSSGISSYIAQVYLEKGDKQNAIDYYKKTITLIDKNNPMAESDIKEYQDIVESLGGEV